MGSHLVQVPGGWNFFERVSDIYLSRVTVHDSITQPLSDEFGLDLQPATSTNIGVQKVSIVYYAILYYTMLLYTVLFCTILCYYIIYYTTIHYTTILCYSIL